MARAASPASASDVQAFRRFNRFYTRLLGTLNRQYLETPYSVQEARVLFELAKHPGCTANDIRARAGFDQGYLSRVVARLGKARLVRKEKSPHDARAQRLYLTDAGEKAFAELDERANAQGRGILERIDDAHRPLLVDALKNSHRLLDPHYPKQPITIRTHRAGDVGWAGHRHAVVYQSEFGYHPPFEAHVFHGLSVFLEEYDPKLDRLWVAEQDGRAVGFIAIHHVADEPKWAQLSWFLVEKEARGKGLGWRLLQTAIKFSRDAGYRGIFLWTDSDLAAARRLYGRAGFALAKTKQAGAAWAPWAREQRWELPLVAKARKHAQTPVDDTSRAQT